MTEIRNKAMKLEKTEDVNTIIGKVVIDNRGKDIGKVKSLQIDPLNLTVEGITISNGLFKERDYVGRDYIVSLTKTGAILSETPLTHYLGMEVIDLQGKMVGTVIDIYRSRKTNSAYSLTVDTGAGNNDLIISDNLVDTVGERIVLNTVAET